MDSQKNKLSRFRDESRCFNASSHKLECHQIRTSLQLEALTQGGHASLVIASQQFGISCQSFPTEYNAGCHGFCSSSALTASGCFGVASRTNEIASRGSPNYFRSLFRRNSVTGSRAGSPKCWRGSGCKGQRADEPCYVGGRPG